MSRNCDRTIGPRTHIRWSTTGAQAAALQITGLHPALPQYARRCPQHIQPSAASCLSFYPSDLPIRCGCAMAQRDRRRMKTSPLHVISAETAQLDNTLVHCQHEVAHYHALVDHLL